MYVVGMLYVYACIDQYAYNHLTVTSYDTLFALFPKSNRSIYTLGGGEGLDVIFTQHITYYLDATFWVH